MNYFVINKLENKNMVHMLDLIGGAVKSEIVFITDKRVQLKNLKKRKQSNLFGMIKYFLRLKNKKTKQVCFIGMHPAMYLLPLIKTVGYKTCWRLTGLETIVLKNIDYGFSRKKIQNYYFRFLQLFADKIIVPSQYMLEASLPQGLNYKKTSVVPNIYQKIPIHKKKDIRTSYRLGKEKIILFVGNFRKVKGIDYLLHAASKMKYQNWQIVLAGGGDEETNLKQLAKKLNINKKIHFLSWIERKDLPSLYKEAHVYVQPSRSDSFGNIVAESILLGTRVIVSNSVGAKDYIQKKYVDVFLIGDLNELTKLLEKRLREQKTKIKNGLKENTIAKWKTVLQQ